MCGIHGFNWRNEKQVKRMMDIAHHRGPDNEGIYSDNYITLGHNLLAITEDAQISKQPWYVDNSRYVLVYNGEIYSYKDLRHKLAGYYRFETDSDTEVLGRALQMWGMDAVESLDGMYAFAWYDKFDNTLLLSRDASGVKPLYYIYKDGKIAFSSSIKSLLSLPICSSQLDEFGFYLYSKLGYVPGPKTLLQDIQKLYPGQVLKFDLQANSKQITNASYHFRLKTQDDYDQQEYRQRCAEAVQQSLMGRRNIGLFLSGGLDSSMILHEMCHYQTTPQTFTTSFTTLDRSCNNDADIADRLSKHYYTKHHDLRVSLEMFLDNFEESICVLEEPHANFNIPAYYLLNKYMAQNDIVVTLSGDGGDEILTGYKHHTHIEPYDELRDILKSWYKLELRRYNTTCKRMPEVLDYLLSWFPTYIFDNDSLNNHLYIESLMHLPEQYLIRNDKLGMSVSMEGRFPLTIPSLKKYILNINSKHKIKHIDFKDLTIPFKQLPKNSYKGSLPDWVINKKKTGWSVPKKEWFYSPPFQRYCRSVLKDSFYKPTLCLKEHFNLSPANWKGQMTYMFFQIWAKHLNVVC